MQTQLSALYTEAAATLQSFGFGKPKLPAGRHLAPKKAAAPLTEIAQVVAAGNLQRRAAAVATAGGLFMSSFAAANLDFSAADDVEDAYYDAPNQEYYEYRLGGFGDGEDDGEDHGDFDDDQSGGDDGGFDSAQPPVYDAAQPPVYDGVDYFPAVPGWVVEVTTTADTPETRTAEGFAVVYATPAPPPPPPPPPARVHPRGGAIQAPPPSVAGNAVLEIAARYIGTPYRWGGNTPAGFDCSGFTTYVFAQLGINLPRTSRAQRHAGTVISRDEAQPGDLVWWPGHVGIFAEGNTFIDAAGPGRTVQFRNMWHSNPTFIRL